MYGLYTFYFLSDMLLMVYFSISVLLLARFLDRSHSNSILGRVFLQSDCRTAQWQLEKLNAIARCEWKTWKWWVESLKWWQHFLTQKPRHKIHTHTQLHGSKLQMIHSINSFGMVFVKQYPLARTHFHICIHAIIFCEMVYCDICRRLQAID